MVSGSLDGVDRGFRFPGSGSDAHAPGSTHVDDIDPPPSTNDNGEKRVIFELFSHHANGFYQ